MTIKELVNTIGFKIKDGDVKKVNDTIGSIKSTATKLLGAIGIGFSLVNMNALVEEFDAVNDKINSAVSGLGDVKEIQRSILEAANDAKSSYSDMADIVSDLVKSSSDLFPVQDAVQFSTNVTKLLKTAGRSEGEIAGIMGALNKSFQKGIVDSETLNQLLENAPEGANLLAESLGVAKSELLTMASEGKMTVTQLKDAFLGATDDIEASFSQLNFGVSDALLNIRNKWGFWLKETDEMLGMTQAIGKIMVKGFDMAMGALNRFRNGVVWLTDKLGGTQNVLKLLGIVVGTIFGIKALSGIMAFIKGFQGIDKAVMAARLKMLGMIAAIVLIALLVEDFINFMQGNDSVIGALFEKAGVDCDKLRKNIIQIWENVRTVLSAIWQGIKNVAIPVFQGIWEAIKTVFDSIAGIIEKVAPKFADFIGELASGKVDTEKWVKVGEAIGKIAVAIAGAVVAVKTATTAVKVATSVVKGATAAISFLTSPVGLVILAIAALIAIGVLLWKNWDKVKAFAISIWTSIKDFVAGVLAGIKNFFVGIWESISEFLLGVWTGITSTVSGALSAIWGAISSIFSAIWEFISGIATSIWDTLTSTFTNIWSSITETVGNIKNSIVEGFQAAIDWITSLPAQALQWGADIIQGIVDGITGAVGKVGEAVKGVADKIKSFLGFSEPEDGPLSDFHTYMPDMMQLMAEGIQKGKSVVSNAIKDLTGGMSDEVKDVDTGDGDPEPKNPKGGGKPKPTSSAGTAASGLETVKGVVGTVTDGIKALVGTVREQADGSDGVKDALSFIGNGIGALMAARAPAPSTVSTVTGSNNVSRSVVQNVEINNRFEGDRAGQQKSSQAAKQAGKDITSELARGLSYAR